MIKKNTAFTLVELIVVITILSILATIAFISLQWFSEDARNSTRITDLSIIKSALNIHVTDTSTLPLPDDSIETSYSWSTLFYQWTLWPTVRSNIKTISNIIRDPLTDMLYEYWLNSNKTRYQVSTLFEGFWRTNQITLLPSTYALNASDFSMATYWNYSNFVYNIRIWDWCNLITIPSLLLENSTLEIDINSSYNFLYDGSRNISKRMATWFWTFSNPDNFKLSNVLTNCSINSLSELNLYIAKLSTAYQQYATWYPFEWVVFETDTTDFRYTTAVDLRNKWIDVPQYIIDELRSPVPNQTFTDFFTDSDWTELVNHTSSWGTWQTESWNASDYIISNNQVEKIGTNTTSLIYPDPNLNETLTWSSLTFRVTDFASWSMRAYLRYIDSSHYYWVEFNQTWYKTFFNTWASESNLSVRSLSIDPWSIISLESDAMDLIFSVNGLEQSRYNPPTPLVDIWKTVLMLQNDGATIDDFNYTYK